MIPKLSIFQRILAWFLFRYERKDGWGAGFDSDYEGGEWLLLNPDHAYISSLYCLMRDYWYVKYSKGL